MLAHEGAFTADDLAASLDDVHVSTVYRSLALLEEIGVVDHVHLAHGPAMYERAASVGTSQHLVCEVCGIAPVGAERGVRGRGVEFWRTSTGSPSAAGTSR